MSGPEAVKVIVRCRPMNKREINLKSQVNLQNLFKQFKHKISV